MENTIYVGQCVGGPMTGETGQSRFPKGFLLVDRLNDTALVYDWDGTQFNARSETASPLSEPGSVRAAEEATYDVRVLDTDESSEVEGPHEEFVTDEVDEEYDA